MNKDTIKIKRALEATDNLIKHKFSGSREAMIALHEAVTLAFDALAALSTEQQEKAPTSSCIGVTYVTQQSDGRFLVVDALAAPDAQPQEQPQEQPKQVCDRCKGIGGGVGIDGVEDDCGKCLGTGYAAPVTVQPAMPHIENAYFSATTGKIERADVMVDGELVTLYAPVQPASKPTERDIQEVAFELNPYKNCGLPKESWRRGFLGERLIAMPGSGSAKLYNEGKQARKDYDLTCCATSKEASKPEYDYAKRLAEYLWRNYYAEDAPQWQPLDGLMSVLSQIDNMLTGLTRRPLTRCATSKEAEFNDSIKTGSRNAEASEAAQYPIGTIEVKGGECVKAWYDAALPDGFHKIYAAQAAQQATAPEAASVPVQAVTLTDADLDARIVAAADSRELSSHINLTCATNDGTGRRATHVAKVFVRRLISGSAKTGEAE